MMEWAGHVTRVVGKTVGKRPLGRPRHRWEVNIKMDVREVEISVMDWINLTEDRYQWRALVNTGMKLRVPQNVEKFLSN
jgi:hypothetical protein